jgi:hypothetical protein
MNSKILNFIMFSARMPQPDQVVKNKGKKSGQDPLFLFDFSRQVKYRGA